MHHKPHPFRIRVQALAVFLSAAPTLWSQGTPDIVARRGLDVRGAIEGPVQVLGEGDVDIAPGATIAGDVVVPPEKSTAGALRGDEKPSDRIKIKNRGGKAGVGGSVRAAASYQPPAVLAPVRKREARNRDVVESYVLAEELAHTTDLAIRNKQARVPLPPNSYGDIRVEQGTLVLGYQGVTEVLRYEFQSLEVLGPGRIEVLSPIVLTVNRGGAWSGDIGDPAAVFWLDVRVAGGEVKLNGRFHGHLTAPASLVTVGERANVVGGLVVDRLVVAEKATLKPQSPDWTGGDARGLAVAHRVLRLQRGMPALRSSTKSRYFPGVSFIEDTPFIMLAAGKQAASADGAAALQHQAVFDAFTAALVDSGFERAGVVLTSAGDGSAPPSARNIILHRTQLESILRELGGKSAIAENIQAVRASPELLEAFMARSSAIHGSPGNAR